MKGVITGKKSWGLWVDQWSDGIVEGSFTEREILDEFKIRDIKVPESFLKDFQNRIEKKRRIRDEKYLQNILKREQEKKRIEEEEKEKNENIRKNSEFLGSGGMWV